MFTRHDKKGKSSQAKPLKDLTRITPAPLLLGEEKREALLRQIRSLCALDEVRFDSLCLSLMHNFINHCQSLPESTSYYSLQGGVLDRALNRTEAALSLFQQYLVLDAHAELSEEQKLWQYALLSAAVLQGVGKLLVDYIVGIYDNNGQLLKTWNPLLENLVTIGSYYSYEFQQEADEEFRRRLNLLIARLLMPASGFAWIASNPQVLAAWLALLNEDIYAAGTLGAVLVRADAIAIQRYFNQMTLRGQGARGGHYGRASTFSGGTPESIAAREQQIGMEVIEWLRNSLEDGRLALNKQPLLMVPGGLLVVSREFIAWFMRDNPEYKNWQVVQKGLLSLGMHKLGIDGSVNSRFEQGSNQQMHSGIVLADYAAVLPEEVPVNNLSTGKVDKVKATEVIRQAQFSSNYFTSQQAAQTSNALPLLDASGKWTTEPAHAKLAMRPGVTSGG